MLTLSRATLKYCPFVPTRFQRVTRVAGKGHKLENLHRGKQGDTVCVYFERRIEDSFSSWIEDWQVKCFKRRWLKCYLVCAFFGTNNVKLVTWKKVKSFVMNIVSMLLAAKVRKINFCLTNRNFTKEIGKNFQEVN